MSAALLRELPKSVAGITCRLLFGGVDMKYTIVYADCVGGGDFLEPSIMKVKNIDGARAAVNALKLSHPSAVVTHVLAGWPMEMEDYDG